MSAVRQSGVTLFELLVVMMIIGILAAIGVPTYRYVTVSSRMSSELNALLGDLQFARSEAVREGQTVSVCIASSTTSPYSCASSSATDWQNGWLVFSDRSGNGVYDSAAGDAVLRVQGPFTNGDTLTASNNVGVITFNRDGFADFNTAQVTMTLQNSPPNSAYTRCLFLSQSGMMTTAMHSTDPSGC